MKTYEMTTRQVCFIMIAYGACSKLLLYPNDLASASGNDLLFSAALDIAAQIAVVWAAAYLCSKTDKTLSKLLEGTFGSVVSRVVMCLFAAFFALSALYPILENKLYVHSVFYDTVPPLAVFLPFFIFSAYAGAKGLRNAARCADICLPIFLTALALIFVLSFGQFQATRLLPVFKSPVSSLGKGALYTLHYFSEGAFMLMFMGRFNYRRGDCAKITLSYAFGGALTLVFLALFYGVFGGAAQSELYAVSKVAIYFPSSATLGRTDFLALYGLEIVSLFYMVLNIQLCCEALCDVFKTQRRWLFSLTVNGVLLALTIILENYFNSVAGVYSKWLWIVFLLFAFVLPPLAWTLRRKS